jgi:hypothetical protein
MHSHESHTPSEGHTPSSSRLCVVQVRARLFLSVSMAVENVRDQTFVVSACKKKLNNNITELTPHTRFSLCLSVKKARSIFSMHRPISTRAMEENSAHKILTPVRIAHRSAPETHPALPTWVRVGWLGCVFLIDLVRKACSLVAHSSHRTARTGQPSQALCNDGHLGLRIFFVAVENAERAAVDALSGG